MSNFIAPLRLLANLRRSDAIVLAIFSIYPLLGPLEDIAVQLDGDFAG